MSTKNILFKYSGNKAWISDYVNQLIAESHVDFESYLELFLGSGAVFLNLDRKFKQYLINDKSPWIYLIWRSFIGSSYTEYKEVLNYVMDRFGDIKKNKKSYYDFRDAWNHEFGSKCMVSSLETVSLTAGLQLLVLASSCLNSMLRFSSSGMNQSFGNRSYIIPESSWNEMKSRVARNIVLANRDFQEFDFKLVKNSVLFLDPPYVNREMTYNKVGFDLEVFIEKVKDLDSSNMVLYTDFDNSISDRLLDYGFTKHEMRTMRSTSPNRKIGNEVTGKEILYLKRPVLEG